MKSPSNQEDRIKPEYVNTVESVNNALNHSVNSLTKETLADIASVRTQALKNNDVKGNFKDLLISSFAKYLGSPKIHIGVPVAGAIIIGISVKYARVEAIPELPIAMMVANLPTEDFAMLEDLEFVTWLAENEQSTLL